MAALIKVPMTTRTPKHCNSGVYLETAGWIIALVFANLVLWDHRIAGGLVFFPDLAVAGEWWRLWTFPLAHVGFYHLILDGCSFLSLYILVPGSFHHRMKPVVLASLGSLLAALSVSDTYTHGLCGLSGPAHGLWAYVALQLATETIAPADGMFSSRRLGMAGFILVAAKCVVEAFTGSVVLESWHLAGVGLPVAACHAGGFLGGLAAWMLHKPVRIEKRPSIPCNSNSEPPLLRA